MNVKNNVDKKKVLWIGALGSTIAFVFVFSSFATTTVAVSSTGTSFSFFHVRNYKHWALKMTRPRRRADATKSLQLLPGLTGAQSSKFQVARGCARSAPLAELGDSGRAMQGSWVRLGSSRPTDYTNQLLRFQAHTPE